MKVPHERCLPACCPDLLPSPAPLQLFLPHATDTGVVKRVLLREGAAVIVRGARVVRLRRGLDLPAISLSEFAGVPAASLCPPACLPVCQPAYPAAHCC